MSRDTGVLWMAAEAAQATGGEARGDWHATGVSIDTRTLQPGDLFVALRDVRDGHDFVADALAKGAAAALVSRVPEGIDPQAPLLMVGDVLDGLRALAAAARARSAARVIAVTGSVGKTSTKEMLRTALSGQGQVHAAEMSLNNHWGVPLTLARMPADTEFALVEIGMNHAGEISPLTRLARPHVAIITNVAEVHMAAFASLDEIAAAKAEIFEGLVPGGTAVLNRDSETFAQLSAAAQAHHARIVTFGTHADADYRLEAAHGTDGTTSAEIRTPQNPGLLRIAAPGRHLAVNGLAVLAAVEAVDADLALATIGLSTWRPPAGRGARHRVALDPMEEDLWLDLIDDAYNANPTSMAAALDVLAASHPQDGIGRIGKGRRVAILTDMLELGADEAERHAALAGLAGMAAVDIVHLAGPLMAHLHRTLSGDKRGEWHETAEALAARVRHLLDAGDVVMVKGSKGSKASVVVDAILKLGQVGEH